MNLAKTKTVVATFETQQGEKTGRTIPAGTTFGYLVKNGTWLQLTSGVWVNGGAQWQYIELLPPTTTPVEPPIPTGPKVTHTIRVNETGQVSLDGLPYE